MQRFDWKGTKKNLNVTDKNRTKNRIKKPTFFSLRSESLCFKPESHHFTPKGWNLSNLEVKFFHLGERAYTRWMNPNHHCTSLETICFFFCHCVQMTEFAGDLYIRNHSLESAWLHWWQAVELILMPVLKLKQNLFFFWLVFCVFKSRYG